MTAPAGSGPVLEEDRAPAAQPGVQPRPTSQDPGGPRPTARRTTLRRFLGELAVLVAVVVAVTLVVKTFLVQPFYIPSASMVPQLLVNDRVVVTKLAYDLHSPQRGDVVVFIAPPSEQPAPSPPTGMVGSALHSLGGLFGAAPDKVDFIKRVIGLPGEAVEGRDGHVYIDGHQLIEPYLPRGTYTSTFGPIVVPRGDLWVMGDNRTDSSDSRVFGPIPISSVIGRAFVRFWPPWRLAFL